MKAIYLLIIFILPGYLFSQNSNSPIIGRVVYNFSHIKDTLNRNQSFKEDMALFFSTDASTFKSYTLLQNDSISNANLADQIKNGQVKNRINLVKGTHEQIVHFYSTGEKVSVNPWGNDTLLIYSEIETIRWEMIDSTKTIGGFSCKKAVGKFKGRIYEAWFCPDIAVKSGPWKLQGLPGLILEAHDTNNEVVFSFASFQNSYIQSFVSLPNNPKKITLAEFEKMKEALIQDPSGYISAMLNGQNSNANAAQSNTNVQIQGPSSQSKKTKKINNPLELIE